ncbi:hypothetical protein, partial [Candidatus Similichlamydia epinepheli]|uniref:hypothetical protein n=1 Tax=Candidatus Similichlamydia epinepheli TaxID=1903953 RepID=UPI00195798E3
QNENHKKTIFVLATENPEEVSFFLRRMRYIGQIHRIDRSKEFKEQFVEVSDLFSKSNLRVAAYFVDLKSASDFDSSFAKVFMYDGDVVMPAHMIVSSPRPLQKSLHMCDCKCLDWSETNPQK